MPTNLDRIQTLLQPDAYAKVRTLAKHNRRALSAMSAELVEEALKLPKYRQQIEDAEIQIPVKEDSREYAPQPQLRREVTAMSKAEKEAALTESLRKDRPEYANATFTKKDNPRKGHFSNFYEGVLKAKELEDEELEDLIPVGSDEEGDLKQTIREQDERLKKMEEMMTQMAEMMKAKG